MKNEKRLKVKLTSTAPDGATLAYLFIKFGMLNECVSDFCCHLSNSQWTVDKFCPIQPVSSKKWKSPLSLLTETEQNITECKMLIIKISARGQAAESASNQDTVFWETEETVLLTGNSV